MDLNPDEIQTLDKLVNLSGEKWFVIKTPNYIWDNDNKIRLSLISACKEFLQCTDSYISKLNSAEKNTIKKLSMKLDE